MEERLVTRGLIVDKLNVKIALLSQLRDHPALDAVCAAASATTRSLAGGGKAIFFGNGGSSMDAGHLAAELLGRFYLERRALAAVSLADATAAMTAIGNDYGYEHVFARQIEGIGQPGDVAIGLSTSGNSPNVVHGLRTARRKGLTCVAFVGAKGGACEAEADISIVVPTTDTPRVQEVTMFLGHTLCELVESNLAAPTG